MKTMFQGAAFAALMLVGVATAGAQSQPPVQPLPATTAPAPEFRYPEAGVAPSSTLRMREIPQTGTWGQAQPPRPVTDTPESFQLYQLCQRNADRAATDIADMQGRIATCLNELNQRRQQGQ